MIYNTIEDMKKDLPWLNNVIKDLIKEHSDDYIGSIDITYTTPSNITQRINIPFNGVYANDKRTIIDTAIDMMSRDGNVTNIRLEGMVDYKN